MSPEVTTAGRRKRMCLGLRPMQWEIVGRSHSRMWERCVVVESVLVSAGQARAVGVNAGQYVHVVDVEGGQVGDLFAFAAADESEFASAEHTRVEIRKLFPRPGDPVLTNRRRPIPFVTGDTSPGRHDMLYATCDPVRYALLGAGAAHRSCAENLREALRDRGRQAPMVPQPLDIFMDVRPQPDGALVSHTTSSRPGDYIAFRAAQDCLIVLSSCPMDIVPISSGGISPLQLEVYQRART